MVLNYIFLGFVMAVQIFGKFFPRYISSEKKKKLFRLIFRLTVCATFAYLTFISFKQYQLWQSNDLSKFLLPPYQNPFYFIRYSLMRIFGGNLISLAIAGLFVFVLSRINKKNNERFFDPEEPYLGGLAFFLCGNPGWLFYFSALIVIYFLIHCGALLFKKGGNARISLYYLWIPVAISVIITVNWLKEIPLWNVLKI